MKQRGLSIFFIVFLCVTLSGCNQQDDPVLVTFPDGDQLSSLETPIEHSLTSSILLNGYLVQFVAHEYVSDQTTFSYIVTGSGARYSLSNFILELPDCVPELNGYAPEEAMINVHPLFGYYGITWNQSMEVTESRSYSITFPGYIPLGIIRTSVKASTDIETGIIAGPCDGFEISGMVYVDADSNDVRNTASELGIANVSVSLIDAFGNSETAITDTNGSYIFIAMEGTYTVRIETDTPANDFNEDLAASFDPSGSSSKIITVGPDSQANDFGFDPKVEKITADLEQGALQTTGEPGKFWLRQLRSAISSSKGNIEFDSATMAIFIAEIEGLFLPDPFQFTEGNEFLETIEILKMNSRDLLVQLKKELLIAEFNEVSGKGLVNGVALQSVLLSWAESVFAEASISTSPTLTSGARIMTASGGSLRDVQNAVDLLNNLNRSTGGGSGGGG